MSRLPAQALLFAALFAVTTFTGAALAQTNDSTDSAELRCYNLCTANCLSGEWAGLRQDFRDRGVDLSLCLEMGVFQNFLGGLETHNANAFSGVWDMNLSIDFDKMNVIPGGSLFFRARSSWNNGIRENIGSLSHEQLLWGSLGDQEIFADKWWYAQKLFDDKLELRVGKLLTLINLFDRNEYAELHFSNSTLICNPTVPHRKSLGMFASAKLSSLFDLRAGIFDADQTDSTECADVKNALHGTGRYIGMLELGMTPSVTIAEKKLPGKYRVGMWYDGRPKQQYFDNSRRLRAYRVKTGDMGWYLSFDQLVYKEQDDAKDKQGLGIFARYGFANSQYNRINHFWSVGAEYKGLLPSRDDDRIGLGISQSILSKDLREHVSPTADRETVYELFYQIRLTPWCTITPDLQLITNPGGAKDADDAFLGGIRVKIAV